MIRRLICALLVCACVSSGALAAETPATASDFVRLHVLAADDSPAAQALKLEIRNVCLRCAEVCLADAPDADAAYIRLNAHISDFESACTARAQELGYEGAISVETGVFSFPDRIYGATRVPAGEYRALRVTIGAGEGHNWWCVLYPSLCVLDETALEHSAVISWLRRRIGGV